MTAVATPPATIDWETVARASAHRIQIAILELLDVADGPRSPKQIAAVLDEPLGVVSYHMRFVRDRGLVELDHAEPVRGALAHFYRLAEGVRHAE